MLRRITPRTAPWAVLVVGVVAFAIVRLIGQPALGDLRIYIAEGNALRDGTGLHGALPGVDGLATYPPFAACVFWPLTFLPFDLLAVLSVIGNAALVAYIAWSAFRLLGLERGPAGTHAAVLTAIALFCEPVVWTVNYGQINLVLVALVLWDVRRPAGSPLKGIGIGLAAALKVTPGIFIVYLLLTRRFRAAVTAVGTFAATIAVSAVADAHSTVQFWTHDLFDTPRVGRLENAVNQSIRGMLVRIDHTRDTPHVQLLLVLAVFVLGLMCARTAYRRLGEPWGLCAAALTGLLCSPISWSHHWVWCVPIGALVWTHVRWAVVPTLLVFCSFAVWAVPHTDSVELHFPWWQIALSGWYVYFGLIALAVIGVRTYRAGDGSADPVPAGLTSAARFDLHVEQSAEDPRRR